MTLAKLWDVEHSYYCHPIDTEDYKSWEDFLNEYGDADDDSNLIFRWDWTRDKEQNELEIFYVMQRRGFLRRCCIQVKDGDHDAVWSFLKPKLMYLKKLWEPL